MKYLLVVLFSGLLVSCNLFASKEKKMRKLVEQEMRDINWNDIDSYPLFENCDETQTKKGQRECFEQEVLFSSDADNFRLIVERRLKIDDEVVNEKQWDEIIPRDFQ